MDLKSPENQNCSEPADFPIQVYGSVGTLIRENPFVCGGHLSRNECFLYHKHNNSWIRKSDMINGRKNGAGVKLTEDRFWITGGFDINHSERVLKETEMYLADENRFENFVDLPERMSEHSLVLINRTHVFLSGGYPFDHPE